MAGTVRKTLLLKKVTFNSYGKKGYVPPRIHELLANISAAAPTVGHRLLPFKIAGGVEINIFMNNFKQYSNGVVCFELCSYSPGVVPPQYQPDPTAANAVHDFSPILNAKNNKPSELIYVAEVLAFGEVVIVEYTRNVGGIALLAKYLSHMAKKHIDEKHYSLKLTDMISHSLKELIAQGKGVEEMIINLEHQVKDKTLFSFPLNKIRSKVKNTDLLRISWRSSNNSALGESEVIEAFDDVESQGAAENIFIKFKDGTTLSNFDQYKIKTKVDVSDSGGKNPNRNELRTALKRFLSELMTADGTKKRLLDDKGSVVIKT